MQYVADEFSGFYDELMSWPTNDEANDGKRNTISRAKIRFFTVEKIKLQSFLANFRGVF